MPGKSSRSGWRPIALVRNDARFQYSAKADVPAGYDPPPSLTAQLATSRTSDLGLGIYERTLVYSTIYGSLTLPETPVPTTFELFVGATVADQTIYSFDGSTVKFTSAQSNVTIRYQMAPLPTDQLLARRRYYTPILTSATFEAR